MLTTTKKPRDIILQDKLHYLAKNLRQHPTSAEATLWQYLKHKKILGYKFRRQYPLYSFIADFYCHEKKLVIEVDGLIHNQQQERDRGRNSMLEQHGYRTIRFTNEQVLYNIDFVIKTIEALLKG